MTVVVTDKTRHVLHSFNSEEVDYLYRDPIVQDLTLPHNPRLEKKSKSPQLFFGSSPIVTEQRGLPTDP